MIIFQVKYIINIIYKMYINKASKIIYNFANRCTTKLRQNFRLFQSKTRNINYNRIILFNLFFLYTTNNIQLDGFNNKKNLKEIIKTQVNIDSKSIKEGQIISVEVPDGTTTGKIIIVRYKNKLYAIGGVCTYDKQTQLKDGICFNDKLYCPKHGCAYDIESGSVEFAPAIDNLPKFYVEEMNGKIYVYTPKYLPKKIQPSVQYRDYTDMRKVVIIGSGVAAFGCIQGLRQNGYSGQITVITKQIEYPYDKTKLTKSIKNLNYDDLILRSKQYYEEGGVNFLFAREVSSIQSKQMFPYLLLEDGTKIDYDGLLIASGTNYRIKSIPGITDNQQKAFYLKNIEDHKKLREKLDKVSEISVLGCTPLSLEFCSTVKKQYPHINIKVIDENKKNKLQTDFGEEISNVIIQDQFANDIQFYTNVQIANVNNTSEKLEINLKQGYSITSDIAVLFPSNEAAATKFIQNSYYLDLEQDSTFRLKTDVNCRTQNRKIFAAGNCSSVQYFFSRERLPCQHWDIAYHEGYNAAYNILALNIPFHKIPFYTFESFGKSLQFVGYNKMYNEVYIVGDLKNWDFYAIFSNFDDIVAVASTPSQKNAANIFTEAFRLELIPDLSDFKKSKWTLQMLQKVIRKINKSGCYKDSINEIKQNYILKDIIWIHRDVDSYVRDPKNQQGYLPGRVDQQGFFKQNK